MLIEVGTNVMMVMYTLWKVSYVGFVPSGSGWLCGEVDRCEHHMTVKSK